MLTLILSVMVLGVPPEGIKPPPGHFQMVADHYFTHGFGDNYVGRYQLKGHLANRFPIREGFTILSFAASPKDNVLAVLVTNGRRPVRFQLFSLDEGTNLGFATVSDPSGNQFDVYPTQLIASPKDIYVNGHGNQSRIIYQLDLTLGNGPHIKLTPRFTIPVADEKVAEKFLIHEDDDRVFFLHRSEPKISIFEGDSTTPIVKEWEASNWNRHNLAKLMEAGLSADSLNSLSRTVGIYKNGKGLLVFHRSGDDLTMEQLEGGVLKSSRFLKGMQLIGVSDKIYVFSESGEQRTFAAIPVP